MANLAVLANVDKLIVKQKKEVAEILTGWEARNRYEVLDQYGRLVFYALEETNTFARNLLHKERPFRINILDASGQPCIYLKADYDFIGQKAKVQIPKGNEVGKIKKEWALVAPTFIIEDSSGRKMFKMSTPMSAALGSGIGASAEFNIKSLMVPDKPVVGKISKDWGTLFKTVFTDATTFGVSFPMDMDVTCKAMLLATAFHVDFAFYEK